MNCQHHYRCALGPLFSKISIPWTQALKYHDRWSINQHSGYSVTDGQGPIYSEHVQRRDGRQRDDSGPGQDLPDFIQLLRTAHDLKLRNYFWNSPCSIFRLRLPEGDWNKGNGKLRRWNWEWRATVFVPPSLNWWTVTSSLKYLLRFIHITRVSRSVASFKGHDEEPVIAFNKVITLKV